MQRNSIGTGSPMKDAVTFQILGVHVGTVGQQDRDQLGVAGDDSQMKRRVTLGVGGVYQLRCRGGDGTAGCRVHAIVESVSQRAIPVTDRRLLLLQQSQNPRPVALLTGVHQGRSAEV